MNWDHVEGNWKEFKGKVQQQWGKLTNDDLDVIEGKRTELAGRLQQRYGVAKGDAERDIGCLAQRRQLTRENPAVRWLREALLPQMKLPRGCLKSAGRAV